MELVVAVDAQWGIGYGGDLLTRIPKDLQFFRSITMGKTMILGRKTLESFPGGKPLPDREHFVLTRNQTYVVPGIQTIHSMEDLLHFIETYDKNRLCLIGGGELYRQLLPLCELAYVTKIRHTFLADTFFPNLDSQKDWVLFEESEPYEYQDLIFTFCKYKNMKLSQQ